MKTQKTELAKARTTSRKTKSVRWRLTPEEYGQLTELARAEASVSALMRKRIFTPRFSGWPLNDVLTLARIEAALIEIARLWRNHSEIGSVLPGLAQLFAIEQRLDELLTRHTK